MRMQRGGVLEHDALAAGPTDHPPDQAENAHIDASSTWNHWCGRGGGISH
jgi:hypothetical protein